MSSTIRGSDNFNSTLSSTLGSSTTNTMHQKAISDAIKFGVAPTHTETATFTGIDNKIVMPGIVTALQLEVGDVIVFSNAIAQNNKPRTVESITDANTIVVNYEHCGSRGDGSLKLTDETVADAEVKLLTKWFVAPVGLGQAWLDVKSTRPAGTNFANVTGRAIQLSFSSSGQHAPPFSRIYVGGLQIGEWGANDDESAFQPIIPQGSSWNWSGTTTALFINELR